MRFVTPLGVLLLASCSATDTPQPGVQRSERGDTSVVSVSGHGTWGTNVTLERAAAFGTAEGNDSVTLGEIRALAMRGNRIVATDGQRFGIRVFDTTLTQVALWGREGSGPGELRNPDGGLAIFTDGRVAVRDPGNARVQLFAPDGRSAGEWAVISGGLRTRDNFGVMGDTLLSRVVVTSTGPIESWQYGLARISTDGRVLDTVVFPVASRAPSTLIARREGNTAELPLPFAPMVLRVWHPHGGFAVANGEQYAITWPRTGGHIRVERTVAAVPISDAEAAQERAFVTKGLQWLDPAWTWNGPAIPSRKPALSALYVGADSTVWVLREGAAITADDPEYEPGNPSSVERRLRSALSFDVWTADGELLGTLPVPTGMQLRPQPVFTRTGLVALEIDSLGVPRVTRYRVRLGNRAPR